VATQQRSRVLPLVFVLVLAIGSLSYVLIRGWSPQLGLDLQGGASVVYAAANDVDDQALDDAIAIIRSRVDALGVAEPEIVRQGDAIVVNLPGVEDQQRALEVIGATAELRFRPVLQTAPYLTPEVLASASTSTTAPGETTATTAPGETTATTAPGETTSTSESALGEEAIELAALPAQDSSTTSTTAAPGDPATTDTTDATGTTAPADGATSTTIPNDACALLGGTTPPEADTVEATVVLPGKEPRDEDDAAQRECFQLGPVPGDPNGRLLVGSIVSDPEATIVNGQWQVTLNIKGEDLDLFNQTASECYSHGPSCPTGRLAIVLDGVVQSAPTINEPAFDSSGLSISGSFTQGEAKDLALVLRFGALPVELVAQTVQQVSPTLGEDSLRAGLVAGFLGVALVAIYMLLYYRALGLVVLIGLSIWSAINFAVVTWLGHTQGLALSLAGVTGIIVSVGVTVDSYVVYFERLKDEIRSGKTIRSSVDKGFERAFRTILAADVSSFIGAALLYTLTVGPVRGFAFFLGLSTILDVFVAWFFTRPFVAMLARREFFTRSPMFGVARGLGVTRTDLREARV
jgi:preprotein translocase subunit SecD